MNFNLNARIAFGLVTAALSFMPPDAAFAQKKYDPGANDYRPIEQLQMMRFTKDQWELFGPVLSSENKPM